jgi:hypothetical protein
MKKVIYKKMPHKHKVVIVPASESILDFWPAWQKTEVFFIDVLDQCWSLECMCGHPLDALYPLTLRAQTATSTSARVGNDVSATTSHISLSIYWGSFVIVSIVELVNILASTSAVSIFLTGDHAIHVDTQ